MNKNRVIELLELLNDDKFVKEVESCFSEKDIRSEKSLSKILELDDVKIDRILKTDDLKEKAYKFYLYLYDTWFKDESKEKLIGAVEQDNFSTDLLGYMKKIPLTSISDYDIDSQIDIINRACEAKDFNNLVLKVVNNQNLSIDKISDILKSLNTASLEKSVSESLLVLDNEKFVSRYDIAKIVNILTSIDKEDNLEMAIRLLKIEGIEDFEYLDFVLEYISESVPFTAAIISKVFESPRVRNIWFSRSVAESIAKTANSGVAAVTGQVSLNEELQGSRKYLELVRLVSEAVGMRQAENGKILIEKLLSDDLLDEFDIKKLLQGVTLAKDEKISLVALKAALNKKLRKNIHYEEIVYNLGFQNSDSEIASNGLKVALDSNLIERPDLLYIVNCVGTDGVKEKRLKAFKVAKNRNLQDKRYLGDMVNAIAHAYTLEQSDLAFKYAMDENNKDLELLENITCLIGKAKDPVKSKVIYSLGYNPEVINLKEEGLEIMREVFKAEDKEEIDYILNTKYDISNLGEFERLSKVFKQDHNSIISYLKTLSCEDINKDTIVRKREK